MLKVSDIKTGNVMAYIFYVKTENSPKPHPYGLDANNYINVTNLDNGQRFSIKGNQLIEKGTSADIVHETKNITKTEAAEKLVSSYGKPFTVTFEKHDGEERVLRGRLIKPEPLLGRSMVEDLDIPYTEHRQRLVDHRTIKSLIVDGIKYVVKK